MKYMKIFTMILILAIAVHAQADDNKVEKSYKINEFNAIFLSGTYEVHLRQGDECKLTIVAKASYFEKLDVTSDDDQLSVELKGKNYKKLKGIELYIQVKDLSKLMIEGAADLKCDNILKVSNLKLEFEGAGKIDLEVDAEKIITEIDGVGEFIVSGRTDYHKVIFTGVGSYKAEDLISKYTKVESSGIGSVKVYASNKFIGEISGIGSVDYYGNPEIVDIDASGIGSVNRRE